MHLHEIPWMCALSGSIDGIELDLLLQRETLYSPSLFLCLLQLRRCAGQLAPSRDLSMAIQTSSFLKRPKSALLRSRVGIKYSFIVATMMIANNPLIDLHFTFQGFRAHFHPPALTVKSTTTQISNYFADQRQGSHDLTSYFRELVK